MTIKMNNTRAGLTRQIVCEGVCDYRWTISKGDEVISSGPAKTLEDARRIVRSTTKFLSR